MGDFTPATTKGGAVMWGRTYERRRRWKAPCAPTSSGYELRSWGPAVLGREALDNQVSATRRSLASASIPPPPPGPSPPTASTAEPTNAELLDLIKSLAESITNLQTSTAALQLSVEEIKREHRSDGSTMGSRGTRLGEHHSDRPPRFQKMDFPKFDGKSDPLAFINRCESYFHQQRIVEEEKVWMASYNLEAGAQLWFMQIQRGEGTPKWRRFTELLNLCFGPPLRSNPLGELMAYTRVDSVVPYQERFPTAARWHPLGGPEGADLHRQIVATPQPRRGDPQPADAHRRHEPLAQDRASQPIRAWDVCFLDAACPSAQPEPALPAPPPAAITGPPTTTVDGRPVKRLSQTKMEERRRLDLCFNCNDKFERGHNRMTTPRPPTISLLAIAGVRTSETMQVHIRLSDTVLVALIDSGSTHNFLANEVASRTGLLLNHRAKIQVRVANNNRVPCPGAYRAARFSIGEEPFVDDFFSLTLAGYDVVLGTRWLATLGQIGWNFKLMTMTFWRFDHIVHWHGVTSNGTLAPLVCTTTDLLMVLLKDFADVFAKPTSMPPARSRDHRITLLSVRIATPSRTKMSSSASVPRCLPSTSAFSSPVLLVKKPDGSWRFCVDYRALNAITVKDAFPIPVVDELLDELFGARFFTKLDLRSSYHQVRMLAADIAKTAFRTHDGLYEFLRRFHRLFVKRSKCEFGSTSVAYLGHTISDAGVAMDPDKVQAVADWPQPHSARAARGFLGLAGYYRKFVKDYGSIATPLTVLLRKEGFSWIDDAAAAFAALKTAITTAPPFVVECDASTYGFGAVLLQGQHPVSFFSRPVVPCHRSLVAYERELIGLVLAIPHWGPYLWERKFLVGKLLGFDFSVEYKSGCTNTVADALSRRDTDAIALLAILGPPFDFIDRLRQAHATDPALVALKAEIEADQRAAPWSLIDGLVAFNGRLYIPPASSLLQEVLTAGCSGLSIACGATFTHPNLRTGVPDHIPLQVRTPPSGRPPDALMPLPVPKTVWADVGLDFIEALPRVGGKSVILTVVDRFSKYCHFIRMLIHIRRSPWLEGFEEKSSRIKNRR
nr:unnamed protein product [Digitaria exilis]